MKGLEGLPEWFLGYSKRRYRREKDRRWMQWWDPWDRYTHGLVALGFLIWMALAFIILILVVPNHTDWLAVVLLYGAAPGLYLGEYLFERSYKEGLLAFFDDDGKEVSMWTLTEVRIFEINVFVTAFMVMGLTAVLGRWLF